ncbi:MAG: ATP cone domain-containing protein [Christensenellales bacterium]
MPEYIKKRDGRLVPYDEAKIASAIDRAFVAAESGKRGRGRGRLRLAKIVTREMRRTRRRTAGNALRRGIFRIWWSGC